MDYLLRVFKFMDVVDYKIALMMYKVYNNLLPCKIVSMFKKRECRYELRGKHMIEKIKSRTKIKDQCISVSGVNVRNDLDDDLKMCQSILEFRRLFKCKVFENFE